MRKRPSRELESRARKAREMQSLLRSFEDAVGLDAPDILFSLLNHTEVSLEDVLATWLRSMAPATAANYRRSMEKFMLDMGTDELEQLCRATSSSIDTWVLAQRARGARESTVQARLSAMASLFRLLNAYGLAETDPVEEYRSRCRTKSLDSSNADQDRC